MPNKIFLFCVLVLASSQAQAGMFAQCVPSRDIVLVVGVDKATVAAESRRACDAKNAVYREWEPKLHSLDSAADAMRKAINSGDWSRYRSAWTLALPIIRDIENAAFEHPQVAGAGNVRELYSDGLGHYLQNAGLGVAASLDDADVKVAAALNGHRADAAATVLVLIAEDSVPRGMEFAKGLADEAYWTTRHAFLDQLAAKDAARAEKLRGDSVSGYTTGLGLRAASVHKAFLFLLALVVFAGSYLGLKTRRNPITSAVRAGVSYLLPGTAMSVGLVLAPFVGQWVLIGGALGGTVFMHIYGGRVFIALADNMAGRMPAVAARFRSVGLFMDELAVQEAKPNRTPGAEQSTHNSHGTSRWGTAAELRDSKYLVPPGQATGFALARIPNAPASLDNRMRHVGHVVTVAPTGAGKGVGQVIPALLEYPGSIVVLDVKGENVAVTARARRDLGNAVHVVDPFGVTNNEASSFNVLDRLDLSTPDCVSESAILADGLVVSDGKKTEGGDHWDESAKTLLQGVMLHVAGLDDPAQRCLGEVRRLLTTSEDSLLELLAEMASDEASAYGIPARAANTLMGMSDRERGSVLSTARRHTAFLDDPRIASSLARSDFDLSAIKSELMTVYLVMPANRIGPNARFVRLFVGSVISAVTASSAQPKHRVAFLLDEFGQLGHMKQIEDAVSLLRGYGLAFWVFIQDLSQLKGTYPKWQTFLANSAKVFFGTDDYDTAKYVSDSLGQTTVEYETHNRGKNSGNNLSDSATGSSGGISRGSSTGTSQQVTGRALLTPDEVMRLEPTQTIVLVRGLYPMLATRLNYLRDREYMGRADANPYHA